MITAPMQEHCTAEHPFNDLALIVTEQVWLSLSERSPSGSVIVRKEATQIIIDSWNGARLARS